MTGPAELVVAKSRVALGWIATITVVTVVSVVLSVQNLLGNVAMAPSALWLLIVLVAILINLRGSGLRGFFVSVLAAFAPNQIVRVRAIPDGIFVLVGFRVFRWYVVEQTIPAESITTISWAPGQGSDMASRDVNDWSVALWYQHGDAERARREEERKYRRPGCAIVVIGPSRAQAITEHLGQRLVTFLAESGVPVSCEDLSRTPGAGAT